MRLSLPGDPDPPVPMSRRVILLLALACGVAVGNICFPQAISPLVASGLHVSPDSAALVVTAAQFGYAAGIFLLVPFGDRLPHRPLIVTLLGLTGLSLLTASGAPALAPLIGVTTVVAQIIVPMAAGPVADDRRGAVTGTLLSGSIGGILLACTFGGTVGEWLGWRVPYLVAAALALLIATVLAFTAPTTTPPSRQRYPALLAEPLRLLRVGSRHDGNCQRASVTQLIQISSGMVEPIRPKIEGHDIGGRYGSRRHTPR